MKKQLVVAKWKEDVTWLKDVKIPYVVYDKDDGAGGHHPRGVEYGFSGNVTQLEDSPKNIIVSPLLFKDADGAPVTIYSHD